MVTERDWHPDDERQQRVADEDSFRLYNATEIQRVYNRLQKSHKIIAELVELLGECHSLVAHNSYGEVLAAEIDEAIGKYQHITGE